MLAVAVTEEGAHDILDPLKEVLERHASWKRSGRNASIICHAAAGWDGSGKSAGEETRGDYGGQASNSANNRSKV